MKAPAVIVVDMLNDFLQAWPTRSRGRLVASINSLLDVASRHAFPVIWIRQEFQADLSDALPEMRKKGIRVTIAGTPGCQIVSELNVAPSDTVIVKKRYSAFFGTALDQTLARLAPDELILAGINTHACIRATAIDAYQRDWDVVIASDCVDSYDREHHEISLRYMNGKIAAVMDNAEICKMLAVRQ